MSQPQSVAEVQRAFVTVKRFNLALRIAEYALLAFMAVVKFAGLQVDSPRLITIALVAAGVLVAVHLATWACPNCAKSWGFMNDIRFCPKCGVAVARDAAVEVPWPE